MRLETLENGSGIEEEWPESADDDCIQEKTQTQETRLTDLGSAGPASHHQTEDLQPSYREQDDKCPGGSRWHKQVSHGGQRDLWSRSHRNGKTFVRRSVTDCLESGSESVIEETIEREIEESIEDKLSPNRCHRVQIEDNYSKASKGERIAVSQVVLH